MNDEKNKPGMFQERRSPETLRLRTITPSLTVEDLPRSVAFYRDGLGFVEGERWEDDSGVLRGLMLRAGSCEIGLQQDDFAKGRGRQKGAGVRINAETLQNPDEVAARVKAAGFLLTEEPGQREWGVRSFSLDDPDGYHITVYQNLA
jgi:uncharacterized protein